MSKTWKWILGILLVFVVIAAFASAGVLWRRHEIVMSAYGPQTFERNWNGPMMGQAPDEWAHPRVTQRNDGWGQPMMQDRGFVRYHSGFSLLGGLVKLILFFGLLYGAYWLGRRNARITLDPAPASPVADVSSPEAESAVPSPEAETPPAPRKRAKKVSDQ